MKGGGATELIYRHYGFCSDSGGYTVSGNIVPNVGRLDFLGNLDGFDFGRGKNNIKVISSPRIMTMNKQEAEITQSGEVFF